MRRMDPGRTGGFTLIEVLATFAILAILLPVIAEGISVCARASTNARRQLVASTLADSKLEELLAEVNLQSGSISGTFPEEPDYRWAAISVLQDTSLLEVMVMVMWDEAGIEKSFGLSSLVYRLQETTE